MQPRTRRKPRTTGWHRWPQGANKRWSGHEEGGSSPLSALWPIVDLWGFGAVPDAHCHGPALPAPLSPDWRSPSHLLTFAQSQHFLPPSPPTTKQQTIWVLSQGPSCRRQRAGQGCGSPLSLPSCQHQEKLSRSSLQDQAQFYIWPPPQRWVLQSRRFPVPPQNPSTFFGEPRPSGPC